MGEKAPMSASQNTTYDPVQVGQHPPPLPQSHAQPSHATVATRMKLLTCVCSWKCIASHQHCFIRPACARLSCVFDSAARSLSVAGRRALSQLKQAIKSAPLAFALLLFHLRSIMPTVPTSHDGTALLCGRGCLHRRLQEDLNRGHKQHCSTCQQPYIHLLWP